MAETRCCTGCERELPLSAFPKDARLKSGVRSTCRTCDASARAERRRGDRPKPGALVLVPEVAAWREPTPQTPREATVAAQSAPGVPGARGGRPSGAYADAAEKFIAALEPPAGDADALLVRSLRGLAELLDVAEHGSGEWAVRDTTALVAKLIAVQRELAATRASVKGAAAAPAPKKRLASGQF